MAVGRIKREIDELKGAEPGRRFESGYERHHVRSRALRITLIVLGTAMVVLSAATFWLPGPQVVVALLGLALVAGQWRFIAHQMDRAEVALRRLKERRWEPLSRGRKRALLGVAWLLFAGALALVAYGAWSLGLLPEWLPLVD